MKGPGSNNSERSSLGHAMLLHGLGRKLQSSGKIMTQSTLALIRVKWKALGRNAK